MTLTGLNDKVAPVVTDRCLQIRRQLRSDEPILFLLWATELDEAAITPDRWNFPGLRVAVEVADGVTRAELILRYTLSHPHCHTTVVGTCDPEHLIENLASVAKGPLATDLCGQVTSRVAELGD